jgi:hypothetical protein
VSLQRKPRIAAVECLIVFLVAMLVTLAVAGTFAGSARSRSARWNQAFALVAQQFRGAYSGGGWFSEPSVRFVYGAAQARLTCYSLGGRSGRTVVQLVIEQQEVRCRGEIISQPAGVRLVPDVRGLSEVELDWGRQFARWEVLAANYDQTRHLMTDAVRLALDRLWLHPLPTETAVSLLPGWIVIRKVWDQPRGVELAQFVELGCGLADQVQVAGATGIEFIASDEPQIIDAAQCSICCEQLERDIVFCVRCKTPHHRECWEYSGGCSTYGCGGRLHFTPGEAPLAGPPHWHDAPSHARPGKPR